ncbi:protein MIGRI [Chitinibacter sp. S2-10]
MLLWQWLGAQRRKQLHQNIRIAARVLLIAAVIALLFHGHSVLTP